MHFTKTNIAFFAMVMNFGIIFSQTSESLESKLSEVPNFIVIFIDDMGYADIGPFGSKLNRTPNLDKMADEGMRLTSFYAAALCTPSRASIMTGSYPKRVGLMQGSWHAVLMPGDEHGLNPDEITMAEVLKQEGYSTGIVGKWHLGDQKPFLPTRHGFDYFYGIPYSNDMIPSNTGKKRNFPPLPLMRNETVIGEVVDQSDLTVDVTNEALKFIRSNADRPFFLYIPHPMVHGPLNASKDFRGRSNNGIYGDAVEEIDWSVGQILSQLKELDIDENTMVVFTSDNGPTRICDTTPLRGTKGTTFEGGLRVPFLVRWPAKIPKGSTFGGITSTMDLLPTFARFAGGDIPKDRIFDGKDISKILLGIEKSESPYESFYYYEQANLTAVRSGDWKLHLKGDEGNPALYNLEDDIGEKNNIIEGHPMEVSKLIKLMEVARKDLGDGLRHPGKNVRPIGFYDNPKALIPSANGLPVGRDSGVIVKNLWPAKHYVNRN
ncbi:Arylsulfatase A [Arenibacter palladensis]|uniref:Arylsulfatase A n=1 Tax=Arenibacter palladensis TaxID=237373 RepID=A0A1M5C4X9_9FLAO|nr:sulfatase [Arenibacter palladensis]SHF49833.1 Arylsulfatase A [Arenibacter palladensis]